MRQVVEIVTEFFGHEHQVDIEDDSPSLGMYKRITRKRLAYGPYKTRRGAENALERRKQHWRKLGLRHPPKHAPAHDPNGNHMFKPFLSDVSAKTREIWMKRGWLQWPDEVNFKIEEKVVSKNPI